MKNEIRWSTPFEHSLPYRLFIKHFTEMNKNYWASTPAATTIEKISDKFSKKEGSSPVDFFYIQKDDERRLAQTFQEWKKDYREFQNYTRINLIVSLCSCFEVYLRGILSLSLESRPGIVFGDKDAFDGARLLKYKMELMEYNNTTYPFYKYIEEIVVGQWNKRVIRYKEIFGNIPKILDSNLGDLEKLIILRNNIAHYFGRDKKVYENPILFEKEPIIRVSHERLLKYFKLIYDVVDSIDTHLYKNYVGSYDILKCYVLPKREIENKNMAVGETAKWLQKLIGHGLLMPVGAQYYKDLMKYYEGL